MGKHQLPGDISCCIDSCFAGLQSFVDLDLASLCFQLQFAHCLKIRHASNGQQGLICLKHSFVRCDQKRSISFFHLLKLGSCHQDDSLFLCILLQFC